jgi:hypothetical protein
MHLSNSPAVIKKILLEKAQQIIDPLVDALSEASTARSIELDVWSALMPLGNAVLTALMARRCEVSMLADLKTRQIQRSEVEVLASANHHASLTTTLGRIRFPLYAYRRRVPDAQHDKVVRTASKVDFLPLLPRCRSSELCLEWETRLGADHPYRIAQQELSFFTHGAVTLEDNTIAAHLVRASAALDRSWLYRTPAAIADILRERAVRDLSNGNPVVYVSSDAHALRRFVDETCTPAWKMANGIRLWCIDRETGEAIHLGGEFTWGDCVHVASIFSSLIALGILPADGRYAPDVTAQLVWLSDGMPWFSERLLPLFDRAITVVLDVYHLLERAAEYAKAAYSKATDAQRWYQTFAALVTNRDPSAPQKKVPKNRKGKRASRERQPFAARIADMAKRAIATSGGAPTADAICALLPISLKGSKAKAALEIFYDYLAANAHRIDYLAYRARGLQIGSGAMESMHRTGSQVRLKRPGAKWLAENAQAIFDWRMLKLVDRWSEFWRQPGLAARMAANWDRESLEYNLNEAA